MQAITFIATAIGVFTLTLAPPIKHPMAADALVRGLVDYAIFFKY